MTQQFAVATLYKWFQENAAKFKAKKAEIEFRDSGDGRAYVRVDTSNYMSELLVKDKGSHLDIERIDLETDESTFPHIGACESLAEFEQQLGEYLDWFEAERAEHFSNLED